MVGSSLNHTPPARVEQWPLVFEVEALCYWVYHQYKAIWDAQVGEQLQREKDNPHDIYAVAILKSGVVVKYVTFPKLDAR